MKLSRLTTHVRAAWRYEPVRTALFVAAAITITWYSAEHPTPIQLEPTGCWMHVEKVTTDNGRVVMAYGQPSKGCKVLGLDHSYRGDS